ncbi:MAG: beta-glucosidase [Acidobacteriota bacterium]|nr:beta-glucosidase [Acidobacteriota bacterium]
MAALEPPHLFRSFWMGGYECSTHKSHLGRLDMIAGTQHDVQAESDYSLLHTANMRTARDGLRWHLIERERGSYDWSSFEPMLQAALNTKTQVIWDVCHYGWPDWLDLFSPEFPDRLARFAQAAARVIQSHSADVPFFAPVNEISFFSWAASRNLMFPYAARRDQAIKRQLVRGALASIQAIREVDSRARFIFPEPTIHVVARRGHPETENKAVLYSNSQFEAWDMIAGFAQPGLGGKPEYLDILGSNFYASNEWEVVGARRIVWDQQPRDPRWRPLHSLLQDTWERYRRPLFLAETSHVGVGRPAWILDAGTEVYEARLAGIPVEGICLYPIIDRYDWGNPGHWHNSGLWDLERLQDGVLARVLNQPYAIALSKMQDLLASIKCI